MYPGRVWGMWQVKHTFVPRDDWTADCDIQEFMMPVSLNPAYVGVEAPDKGARKRIPKWPVPMPLDYRDQVQAGSN